MVTRNGTGSICSKYAMYAILSTNCIPNLDFCLKTAISPVPHAAEYKPASPFVFVANYLVDQTENDIRRILTVYSPLRFLSYSIDSTDTSFCIANFQSVKKLVKKPSAAVMVGTTTQTT